MLLHGLSGAPSRTRSVPRRLALPRRSSTGALPAFEPSGDATLRSRRGNGRHALGMPGALGGGYGTHAGLHTSALPTWAGERASLTAALGGRAGGFVVVAERGEDLLGCAEVASAARRRLTHNAPVHVCSVSVAPPARADASTRR